ncbi:20821_t:CDS:2, partial [Entrophospora sp. SA101]
AVETDFTLVRTGGNSDFSKVYYEGYDPLSSKDIADCIVYAAGRPQNVVISILEVLPNAQADIANIYRSSSSKDLVFDTVRYKYAEEHVSMIAFEVLYEEIEIE